MLLQFFGEHMHLSNKTQLKHLFLVIVVGLNSILNAAAETPPRSVDDPIFGPMLKSRHTSSKKQKLSVVDNTAFQQQLSDTIESPCIFGVTVVSQPDMAELRKAAVVKGQSDQELLAQHPCVVPSPTIELPLEEESRRSADLASHHSLSSQKDQVRSNVYEVRTSVLGSPSSVRSQQEPTRTCCQMFWSIICCSYDSGDAITPC